MEEPVRCVLTAQTYGPVDPLASKTLRIAVMHASNNGIKWVSDVSVDGWTFSAARNNACTVTLEAVEKGEKIDYLVWIDSDIICEPNSITRLVKTVHHFDHDFVTGIYYYKSGEHRPVIYEWEAKWWPNWGCFKYCTGFPENAVTPIGGCGFGFTVTSVKMIAAMKQSKHWHERGMWFPDTRDSKGGFGEDLSFCKLAMQTGFQLYCDTGIQVGHQGKGQVYTWQDFSDVMEQKVLEARHLEKEAKALEAEGKV